MFLIAVSLFHEYTNSLSFYLCLSKKIAAFGKWCKLNYIFMYKILIKRNS